MLGFIGSMGLAIVGVVLYHLAVKLQPHSVSPFLILAMAYCVAALLSTGIYLVMPFGTTAVKDALLSSSCFGVVIVVVELGFLLVYRAGWDTSVAGVFATVAATVFLVPVGVFFLKENVSRANLLGILLCLVGLFLASRK
ncbi:MAG: hypothetical protein HC840_32370 [Leptolyngbyaceae cyanobacterium RM2_2_4]|nr:hypothetical protein [Leptolyngbyaceae cyanobacterium SM1_4_3]NJN89492.1 hypothetical protein [Leptolyngbyaceae cyanobacterium SL_5_14]NJO53326.1 hypothetical protein [Leptolyngbyaceae cyanobacterium RM2_2_4]